MFRRAKQMEANGEWEAAEEVLLECIGLDEKDSHSWLALANNRAHVIGNQVEDVRVAQRDARKTFLEAVDRFRGNVHLIHAFGMHELRCGNVETARQLFSRGLKIQPDNPYVAQSWGLLEQRAGNLRRARSLFSRCVAIRPQSEVCGAWAVLEAREGDVTRARELFDLALRSSPPGHPSAAAVLRAWAAEEDRLGDTAKARELLKRAAAMFGAGTGSLAVAAQADAALQLAKLEAKKGANELALEILRSAASKISLRLPTAFYNGWAALEMDGGFADNATKILRKAIELYPQDASLLQTLGTVENKLGNLDVARDLFRKSIAMKPLAPTFVAWALLEEQVGDVENARKIFDRALLVDPLHSPLYNAWGMMEARQGDLENCRRIYDRGIAMSTHGASLLQGYGQFELNFGKDPVRAKELFILGTKRSRDENSYVWHSLGMIELRDFHNSGSARDVFVEALKRYPRNSQLLVGAGLAYSIGSPGKPPSIERARDYFKRAVIADTSHAHAWQAWAVFELRMNNKDNARKLFQRGLKYCPSHGALWQAFAVLEMLEGNFPRARSLFEKGIETSPGHVHLMQAWACMEVRVGNITRARQLLIRGLEVNPNNGALWNSSALLEAKHGSLFNAREKFSEGLFRDPDHAPLYRCFAQTETKAGNYSRARDLYRQGLEHCPYHAPLYHAYAEFESIFGNVQALAELKKATARYFGSEDTEPQRASILSLESLYEEGSNEKMRGGYDDSSTSMDDALDGDENIDALDL